jgi:rhodanese-related sulfurtransferase
VERLFEYAIHHPYLFGAAVVASLLVLFNEFRERMQSFAAVGTNQAVQLINQGALVLDVRGRDLYDAGHIREARHVDAAQIGGQGDTLKKWREKNVITYCDTGTSGAGAARALQKLGFTKVFNLAGGLEAWRKDNLPISKATAGGRNGK